MRKFRLACFDLDGTLIDSPRSIWQLVHEKLGTDNEARKKVMKDFYEGRISYREWAEHDIMIWKKSGLRREKLMEIISSLKVMPGARETLAELKRKGIKLAVISGSLKDVLDYFFPETFDYVYINEILWNNGEIAGIRSTEHDQEGKARALREICSREKIPVSETLFVGDHDNDVEIAKEAGFSVAFNAESKALIDVCDAVVEKKDLREVLKLFQGR